MSSPKLVVWTHNEDADVLAAIGSGLNKSGIEVSICKSYGGVPNSGATAVLCLGPNPIEVMGAASVIPKGRTVGSLRNTVFQAPDCAAKMLFSYAVGISKVDYSKFVDLQCDVSAAIRLAKTGSIKPQYGNYKYVDDFKQFIAEVEVLWEVTKKPIRVALDLETLGLDPYSKGSMDVPGAYIITIQLSHTKGQSSLVYLPSRAAERDKLSDWEFASQMDWLLNSPKVKMAGANLKYDLNWLAKRGGFTCSNFKFDTTLVGSLLDENRSNGLDVHCKMYAPELGGYCVAPETKIWMSDLTWKQAKDIKIDDELVGFDEHTQSPKTRRKLRKSNVQSVQELKLRCYELIFSDGRKITVSDNHAWLVLPGTKGGNLQWVQTEKLKIGTRMKVVTEVVEQKDDYDGGWVAGFLDGEGHVSGPKDGSRFELGWAQKPGLVWERAASLIHEVCPFYTWTSKAAGVLQAKVATYNSLKMLQRFRPVRLLAKEKWVGCGLPQEPEQVQLIAKKLVGVQSVVSIKTSTSTFVAEGLASHNSDEFDKKVDKSRMDKVLKDDMLLYAGGDSDATLRVADVQEVELKKDPSLTGFYVNIMHPASRAFEMVEQGGCLVDMDAYKQVEADLNTELSSLVVKAKSLIGGRLVAKHADPDKPGGMNLTKASLLTDFMFSPMGLNLKPKLLTAGGKDGKGVKAPSTAIDHLLSFGDVPEAAPFVALLKDYSSASKTLTTYVTGFLKHLRSDGRYHPSFYFFAGKDDDDNDAGTNTGRLSAKAPAFQTIPKHTKWAQALRRCFVAPPGMLMMERDYSQGELRVIACLANEENMIQAYLNDLDLHALTSGGFEGYSYEDMMALKKSNKALYGAIRQLGKAGNFGLIYGMGVDGFFIYATTNYGVKDFTLQKAAAFRTGFFDRYPGLLTYHAQQKNIAGNYGFVRSPLGRIRHLPLINSSFKDVKAKAERQAINSPTQGTLSDMVLWSAAIEHKSGYNITCPMFGATHDSMCNYVPEDDYLLFGQRGIETMENLPFELVGWQPQLKFTADLKIGKNMGDLEEIQLPPF